MGGKFAVRLYCTDIWIGTFRNGVLCLQEKGQRQWWIDIAAGLFPRGCVVLSHMGGETKVCSSIFCLLDSVCFLWGEYMLYKNQAICKAPKYGIGNEDAARNEF